MSNPSSINAYAIAEQSLHVRRQSRGESFNMLVHHHRVQLDDFIWSYMTPCGCVQANRQQYDSTLQSIGARRGALATARWTFGIALNLVCTLSCESHHHCAIADQQAVLTPLQTVAACCLTAISNAQHLHNALSGLPPELRLTLLLAATGELSFERAAILLTLPIQMVRDRIARILRRSRVVHRAPQCGHVSAKACSRDTQMA